MDHLTDDELERHLLGNIPEGPELDHIEEHLLWCQGCIDRSMNTEAHLKIVRAVLRNGRETD
jgi:hypothetical protein